MRESEKEEWLVATWDQRRSLKKYRRRMRLLASGPRRIRRNSICNAIALALYGDSIINPRLRRTLNKILLRDIRARRDSGRPLAAQYSLIKRPVGPPPQIPERDCFVFVHAGLRHATAAELIGDEKINREARRFSRTRPARGGATRILPENPDRGGEVVPDACAPTKDRKGEARKRTKAFSAVRFRVPTQFKLESAHF